MDQSLASLSRKLASTLGGFMIIWSMFSQFLPYELKHHLRDLCVKLQSYLSPYEKFIIEEYTVQRMSRHELYTASKAFLSDQCSKKAQTCRIELGRDREKLLVTVGDRVEVTDDFKGAKIWWRAHMHETGSSQNNSRTINDERRYFRLTFHKRHRELIEKSYLKHVLETGRAINIRNRQRRLFTNSPTLDWSRHRGSALWSHVPFQHPSTFKTLAMDPIKKQEIVNDLTDFRKAKEYYSRIGKAWKRGYLLYGPPGTGKSSMISAIANFMEYDIYDLELTAVKSNSDLRKLVIETKGKSIIVIEDIDCSLDLAGRRKEKKKIDNEEEIGEKKRSTRSNDEESIKVTLSGLLNFIDGLWSSCGEERILIFTTNHVEKLDPALIRTGRMDKHIEMSYCDFESFKVLAKNYLEIESHDLFDNIMRLLKEVKITPADVAENLLCMSSSKKDVDGCLERLIRVLEAKKFAMEAKENDCSVENCSLPNSSIENDVLSIIGV
ncbi:hypothetical protein LUZ60_010631 [Juncus effusus]|nr:hypothetical protein LUZ60_010631 [Juncus effusus]